MIGKGAVSAGDWIDPDDAQEWTEEMFAQADLYEGDRLIGAGVPPSRPEAGYELVLLRETLVRRFRETGPGWQSRMDEALTRWLDADADR